MGAKEKAVDIFRYDANKNTIVTVSAMNVVDTEADIDKMLFKSDSDIFIELESFDGKYVSFDRHNLKDFNSKKY